MGRVVILTDSSSGIRQAEAQQLGISVLPMPFFINGETLFEDINLTQDTFYEHLTDGAEISTSMPAVGDLTDRWDELLKEYDEIVFIHFRKYNQQEKEKRNASPTLISATLRIEKRIIANEFSTIFDSIKSSKKDMLAVIRCKDITTENLSEKIRKYKRLFEEAVKEYQMSQGVLEDSNIPLSKNDKE